MTRSDELCPTGSRNNLIPNTFQTPNVLIDRLMPLLKDDELRVVMFAVRHIYGWTDTLAKRMAQLSLTAFERGARGSCGCGLSRPAIVAALQGLEQYHVLRCVGENARGRYWALAESDADMDWDGLEERRVETDAKNRRKTAAASRTGRTRKPEQAGTSHVPGVRPTYQPDGTTDVPEKGYVPRTTGTADVPAASTTHVPPAGTTDVHIETHVLKPTSDDDPSDTPEKNIKQTTSSLPPEDVREVLSELQSLGLSAPLRRQVLQEGTERALALALHAQGEGRNPAGLLISMLRQGSDPAPKYVELARIKLQPPAPLPSQVTTSSTPQHEPVGLDEHPGGGALSVRDLWHTMLGQFELQLNRATFDTWLKGATVARYEDDTLWIQPRNAYADQWFTKSQMMLDGVASRLAGMPLKVRCMAVAQAAGG